MTDDEMRAAAYALMVQCTSEQRDCLVDLMRLLRDRVNREDAIMLPFHQYMAER